MWRSSVGENYQLQMQPVQSERQILLSMAKSCGRLALGLLMAEYKEVWEPMPQKQTHSRVSTFRLL